jgi:tetratricopeptide (TPR) repeat protein
MKCPVCRATFRSPEDRNQESGAEEMNNSNPRKPISQAYNCHRCGVDLSPLIYIHDQALWYHRQAIQERQVGNYSAATAWNNQALALHSSNADFHALSGQIYALQGEFRQAIIAWEKARQLNPQHRTANVYLQELKKMIEL